MSFAFGSVSEFLAMGHHGVYVWSAWLISVFTLLVLILQTRHARRQFYTRQARFMRQQHIRLQAIKTSNAEQTP
jgi:heme exporter protein D